MLLSVLLRLRFDDVWLMWYSLSLQKNENDLFIENNFRFLFLFPPLFAMNLTYSIDIINSMPVMLEIRWFFVLHQKYFSKRVLHQNYFSKRENLCMVNFLKLIITSLMNEDTKNDFRSDFISWVGQVWWRWNVYCD